MYKIDVSYVRLNLDNRLIEYNNNFIDFFGLLPEINYLGSLLRELVPDLNQVEYLESHNMYVGYRKSLIIFRNHILDSVNEPLVSAIYLSIYRDSDSVIVKMVNWLNWINLINLSLDNGYSAISKIDETKYRKNIRQLIEIYWFKGLSPLLMHIPSGLIGLVSSWAFFDILKLFNNKRGKNYYSKDYNRDTISRVCGKIKRETKRESHLEVGEVITNDSLVNLRYNKQLFIPYSILNENIIVFPEPDILLEDILNLSNPDDRVFK